jgi:hypothetical protein
LPVEVANRTRIPMLNRFNLLPVQHTQFLPSVTLLAKESVFGALPGLVIYLRGIKTSLAITVCSRTTLPRLKVRLNLVPGKASQLVPGSFHIRLRGGDSPSAGRRRLSRRHPLRDHRQPHGRPIQPFPNPAGQMPPRFDCGGKVPAARIEARLLRVSSYRRPPNRLASTLPNRTQRTPHGGTAGRHGACAGRDFALN